MTPTQIKSNRGSRQVTSHLWHNHCRHFKSSSRGMTGDGSKVVTDCSVDTPLCQECSTKFQSPQLSVSQLTEAENYWLRRTQCDGFPLEAEKL